jgi:hypothetical protein
MASHVLANALADRRPFEVVMSELYGDDYASEFKPVLVELLRDYLGAVYRRRSCVCVDFLLGPAATCCRDCVCGLMPLFPEHRDNPCSAAPDAVSWLPTGERLAALAALSLEDRIQLVRGVGTLAARMDWGVCPVVTCEGHVEFEYFYFSSVCGIHDPSEGPLEEMVRDAEVLLAAPPASVDLVALATAYRRSAYQQLHALMTGVASTRWWR